MADSKLTLSISEWVDFKDGDPFPDPNKLIKALGRPLKTPAGDEEQFVGLWYWHGHAIMGRVCNRNGLIHASFSHEDKEFTGRTLTEGIQILVQPPSSAAGFVYVWKPLHTVSKYDNKEFHPVHISFMAPCVLNLKDGREVLGGANLREEYAQSTVGGHVVRFLGKEIANFNILCRKMCDDTMQI